MSKCIDMTGWIMSEHGVPDSKITVITRAKNNNDRRAQWLCRCSCDNDKEFIVSGKNLRSGSVKSCGCLKVETMINAIKYQKHEKKGNDYCLDLNDEYGIYGYGLCSNTKSKFYFDMEDYGLIFKYTWYEYFPHENSQFSTVVTNYVTDDGKRTAIRMHQFLGFKNYDHEDRNELNNRKYNLRKCTSTENSRNRNTPSNNTSGFIGVVWDKNNNKWMSSIEFNKKYIYLGRFIVKDDAIIARLKAEKKYYGEFAPQRHLFEEYGI